MVEPAPSVAASIRRVWSETPKLTGVVLEVPEPFAAAYSQPGQYVVVESPAGKKVFLAITSAPGEARALELLLAEQALRDLAPTEGSSLVVAPPAGRGFQVESALGRDVVVFAIGSAIGAIRPIVEVIRRARAAYGRVTLFLGAHTEADFPYARAYDAWAADGIDVRRSVSHPWVQERFAQDPVPVEGATAFLCGHKAMMEAVTATLGAAGLPADRIRKNF